MTATIQRPSKDEYAEYYGNYIQLVPEDDIQQILWDQIDELHSVLDKIPEPVADRIHPPYTWTIKQVVGHLIDCERSFGERLHRFACGDTQPIPGIDQNPYVEHCDYKTPKLAALTDEMVSLRRANSRLLERLEPVAWERRGIASDVEFSVRSLAYILAGHVIHHLRIIRQRIDSMESVESVY